MKKIIITAYIALFTNSAIANTELDELKKQLAVLSKQVNQLSQKITDVEAREEKTLVNKANTSVSPVVFDTAEISSLDVSNSGHVLSDPWWINIDVSGFAAVGAYGTGSDGKKEDWGFEIKEATIFLEAAVWENVDFFLELQTNRLGDDKSKYTRTGEVYVHLRDVAVGDSNLGFKFGRIDLPFGEEYLWQDAIDNPLIQNSTSYLYGWDEGALVYGQYNNINWIFSITDGNDERSIEDHADKAFNAKFYGNVTEDLYLSLSLMRNGESAKSAIEFGGSHFEPVDGSSSDAIDSWLIEFNTKYQFVIDSHAAYIAVALGTAHQDDSDSLYDRDIIWFTVEPYLALSEHWYTLIRYSEIGTYDDEEGYHFDGKPFAGGNNAYGYDVERFRRLSFGLGWKPNPRIRVKFELGNDWYDLIAPSTKDKADDRGFLGAELAVGF